MELYESKWKKFINVETSQVLTEGIDADDAMRMAKTFYDTLMGVDNDENRVLSYIKNITANAEFVKDYSVEDHIEAYTVSESQIEEGISTAILSVLASAIMSGSVLSTDTVDPDKFDHGDGIEMTSADTGVSSKTGKWKIKKPKNNDPHSPDIKGIDPHK